MSGCWKVGELAKRTGTTVRTLHHYDRIGLLSPSRMTESGHRLYTDADVVKLHHILSLKQLGFALEEIKAMIHSPSFCPEEILKLQLSRLNEQIGILVELKDRTQNILDWLHSGQPISGEQFMLVMQMIRMMQSPHFSKGLADELERRSKRTGLKKLEEINAEGQILIAEFRSCLTGGKPPDDPDVAELARRWKAQMDAYAPADAAFVQAAERYYGENPEDAAAHGMDSNLYTYIKTAVSLIEER
ncbi:MerR family transcriptional regulator [Paenibacillus sp. sptzw28]|uniref:MerR family transcriptional regulator n=1 Tax=Paenibacillus sp. sptzw28 TaxID=715179 RepID=UPI001C6EAA7C|nr:MerR family transcriptional regulator [Paenibacillus sp. sptzw28]QYR21437.1 MerR family transcriptional regulator [Paenibacillus sp. sptzw28]